MLVTGPKKWINVDNYPPEEIDPVLVECYAGAAYPEKPLALTWEGERLEIAQIEYQARTPDGWFYRVRTMNSEVFELRYEESNDRWYVSQP